MMDGSGDNYINLALEIVIEGNGTEKLETMQDSGDRQSLGLYIRTFNHTETYNLIRAALLQLLLEDHCALKSGESEELGHENK
jgi:hypothetical protein